MSSIHLNLTFDEAKALAGILEYWMTYNPRVSRNDEWAAQMRERGAARTILNKLRKRIE